MMILEEGNTPHPQCLMCDMLVLWRSLNGMHWKTAQRKRGLDMNRRRLAAEEEQEVTSRAFSAYGHPLEMVNSFQYLGRVISAVDEN